MGREIKRVPLDFDWPWADTRKPWKGYLSPDSLNENPCPDCKSGYAPHAQRLHSLWYGYIPFSPEITGSTLLTPETPAARAFAERNVTQSPDYYGVGEVVIVKEAQRLADLWNGMWCHHLSQEDVDALAVAGRLMDFTHTFDPETRWQKIEPAVTPTAAEVNEWSLRGWGHDSINAGIAIQARCERDGKAHVCSTCEGHGSLEAYEGQRADADSWEREEPPVGDGWQLWETVSEGSPITPVFETPEELAQFMATNRWGRQTDTMASSVETALRFIQVGWAPSGGTVGGQVVDGVELVGGER